MKTRAQQPRTARRPVAQGPDEGPRFSREFMREVGACADVEQFRELLSRRNLWVNRNAAEGVFRYLKQSLDESLPDEELAQVTGGVPFAALGGSLQGILNELSRQLGRA